MYSKLSDGQKAKSKWLLKQALLGTDTKDFFLSLARREFEQDNTLNNVLQT